MKLRVQLCLIISIISLSAFCQNPTATIATWKNNALGAYSLIHDDYGSASVNGIENYADTIANNRGVVFTFGAITSACSASDWTRANQMMANGHEIINHSHNHYCGQPVAWCATNTWDEDDFDTEIDLSNSLIHSNTGHFPRFYIFPYDLHTDAMLQYLEDINYLGARAGAQSQYLWLSNMNNANFPDPFRVNFFVYGPSSQVSDLNGAVDMAINNNGWSVREVHGVQDGSWASISADDYRAHMDYIRTKTLAGEIWAATVSEVLTYKQQREGYTPTTIYQDTLGDIKVIFDYPGSDVDTNLFRTPVTLNMDLDGLNPDTLFLFQRGVLIDTFPSPANNFSFEVYPHQGVLTFSQDDFITAEQESPYIVPVNVSPTFFQHETRVRFEEAGKFQVLLVDIQGKTHYRGLHQGGEILHIGRNLADGYYFLKVQDDFGARTIKLVKGQ